MDHMLWMWIMHKSIYFPTWWWLVREEHLCLSLVFGHKQTLLFANQEKTTNWIQFLVFSTFLITMGILTTTDTNIIISPDVWMNMNEYVDTMVMMALFMLMIIIHQDWWWWWWKWCWCRWWWQKFDKQWHDIHKRWSIFVESGKQSRFLVTKCCLPQTPIREMRWTLDIGCWTTNQGEPNQDCICNAARTKGKIVKQEARIQGISTVHTTCGRC